MSSHFYDLLKYKKTGIANPNMTSYDKVKAHALCGGSIPINTITGEPPLTFRSDGSALTAWSISGSMAQSGTPTPSSPIQPQECGDPTANMCNVSNDNKLTYNSSYDNYVIDDDEQTVTTSGNALVGFLVPVDASTTYTVYAKSTEYGMLRIREYSDYPSSWSGAEYIQQTINNQCGYAYNFTTTATTKWICVAFYFEASHAGAVISDIMLNAGSTPLDYVPYGYALDISCGGETKTVYLREPLRKIGDYADSIGSDGTVTRNILKIDLTQFLWKRTTSSGINLYYVEKVDVQLNDTIMGVCNALKPVIVSSHSSMIDNSIRIFDYSGDQRIISRYDAANADVNAFTQMILETNAQFWVVLETPKTETATVPTITTTKGSNTLSVDTSLAPSSVSITGHISE